MGWGVRLLCAAQIVRGKSMTENNTDWQKAEVAKGDLRKKSIWSG